MKGSVTDLPILIALIFSGAITIFIVYLVLGAVATAWPAAGPGYAQSKYVLDQGLAALGLFDNMFLLYAFGMGMVVIISGFFIDSHPGLFVFSVFLYLPIVIVTSAQITNAFYAIATTSTFTAIAETFPLTTLLILNLPLFILVIGILTAIVVHGKTSGGGTGI
jgi:hypothetical protein